MENGSNAVAPQTNPRTFELVLRAAAVLTVLTALILVTVNVWILNDQQRRATVQSREHAFWLLCHNTATPPQRTSAFLQLVSDGNTEWKSAQLERLQLTGNTLRQTQLASAQFSYCEFKSVDFGEAVLDSAGLDNCRIDSTSFDSASLNRASLFKSHLSDCSFRNTELLSASLEQAVATGCSFVAAKMGDAFLAMADLSNADLTGADLSNANLEATILKDADLALTNLYRANLTDTDLSNTNWWRSRGLSTEQLDDLTTRFPPSPTAAESRQRDFTIWLKQRIEQ